MPLRIHLYLYRHVLKDITYLRISLVSIVFFLFNFNLFFIVTPREVPVAETKTQPFMSDM